MVTALSFRRVRTYNDQPRIWFENLETRRLFSAPANLAPVVMLDDANQPVATVEIIDGVLTVTTSDGVDDAMIGSSKSHPDQLFVHNNGARSFFSREGITGISVNLGDGDDAFDFHNENGLLNLPTTINGGAGDDEFGGENDIDYIGVRIQNLGDGPFAPVHLIGGDGNDTLIGALGDTVAEGGPGIDKMYGRKTASAHNGLFTILDPAPITPIPEVIDDGQASPGMYFLDDFFVADPVIIVVPPADNQQPLPTTALATTSEPQADVSSGASALPTTLPLPTSLIRQDSLLVSHASLLGHQSDEIW